MKYGFKERLAGVSLSNTKKLVPPLIENTSVRDKLYDGRKDGFLFRSKALRNGVYFVMQISTFDVLYDNYEDVLLTEDEKASVLSAADALIKSVNKYGRVDLEYMSESSGRSKDELIDILAGKAIFQNPLRFARADEWNPYEGWLLSSQYLCGNIPEKLSVAKKVNAKFCCFDKNIAALETLVPHKVDSMSIHMSLGATWITNDIYVKFIAYLLQIGQKHVSVIFNPELSVYRVEVDNPKTMKASVLNNFTYGTPDLPALKIIEHTMNAKPAKVYDYIYTKDDTGKNIHEAVLNQAKTVAAQEKQSIIISKFEEWTHENKKRLDTLCELYNDKLVGYTFTPFDGSFLDFEDLNPEVSLYPHQKNSIARILLSDSNILLAHDVGTGKTYEMVCGVHELYRTGLSKRNLIVVPNGVLEASVNSHKYLYPNDNILVIRPSDFTPAKRNERLEELRDGDYVCAYMAFSSFDMVVMSKRYWVQKKQERITELRRASATAKTKKESNMLSSEADYLALLLDEYIKETPDSPWLTFDRLGIETLVVDEAHNYKNIKIPSRTENITGFHGNGSKKCIEMYEKSQFVKRLIFATGTPLTNSLADLFVFQRYLQPQELKYRKIDTLDTWVNTFAELETNYEVDVDARHLRQKTRFSKFHNLPELMAMFSNVSDFYQEKDKTGLPLFGEYEEILVERSEWQQLYVENLSLRADAVHARAVSLREDNLLKITTDGRLCALDIRFADKELYDEKSAGYTKTAACADKIMEICRENPGTSQIVFSDIGTPKAAFNVYDDLKEKLIQRGMAPTRIAYIHEASTDQEKTDLFAAVNAGDISVVIGSTPKLGTGVNVQKRLIALHHLDVPWKPADMIQREGRILRKGNSCEQVNIFHYITEGTFDSFSWQLLEKKARFLDSFLSGIVTDRDADEIDNTVLRYSEIKALAIGNPLIKRRVEVANQLDWARIAFRSRQRELTDVQTIIETNPSQITQLDELIAVTRKDVKLYAANKESVSNDERISFGEELIEALFGNHMRPEDRLFDNYQGFDVFLPAGMKRECPYVLLKSMNGGNYKVEVDRDKPIGCSRRIDYMLDHLPDRIAALRSNKRAAIERMEEADINLSKGNPHQEAVDTLADELEDIDRQLKELEETEKAEKEKEKENAD